MPQLSHFVIAKWSHVFVVTGKVHVETGKVHIPTGKVHVPTGKVCCHRKSACSQIVNFNLSAGVVS